MRRLLVLAAALLPILTQTAFAGSDLLWTIPVSPDPNGEGFWVADSTMLNDGRVVVLGREGEKVSLMVEEETGTLAEWTTLPLDGALLNVTADPANGLWLTGHTRDGSGLNGPFRDAAIIRLNRNGVIAWGRVFGAPDEYWSIEDAAIIPTTGGIVISGDYGHERSFLAAISVTGEWLWQKTFGLPGGTRVGVNENGDIFVVGFDAGDTVANVTSQDATVWIYSDDGDLRAKTPFLPDIDFSSTDGIGTLALEVDEPGIDVAVGWNGPLLAQLAIATLAPNGALLGTVNGVETANCVPSLASDSNRLWLGCAVEGRVAVYKIDRAASSFDIVTAEAPSCQGSPQAIIEMAATAQGLLVFGRPADNATAGCAWLMLVTP